MEKAPRERRSSLIVTESSRILCSDLRKIADDINAVYKCRIVIANVYESTEHEYTFPWSHDAS